MKARFTSAAAVALLLGASSARAADHVACVGDSITAGSGYPAALQSLLGASYAVENDGHSGATLLKNGDLPYTSVAAYGTSKAWAAGGADVVIQLGTNDSKPGNWANKAAFQADCEALVDQYRTAGAARVWINLIPPAFANACCTISGATVKDEILPLLRQCAANKGASTIDVYSALLPHPEYFADGVHPNATGAALIASTVRDALVKRPTVTVAAEGTTFTATPAAAYGKVENVELLEGTTSRGKKTAAPWTFTVTGLAPGSHTLRAVVTETGGRAASSSDVTVLVAEPPAPPDASTPSAPDASAVEAGTPDAAPGPSASSSSSGAVPLPNTPPATVDAGAPASATPPSDTGRCSLGGGGSFSAAGVLIVLAAWVRRRRR